MQDMKNKNLTRLTKATTVSAPELSDAIVADAVNSASRAPTSLAIASAAVVVSLLTFFGVNNLAQTKPLATLNVMALADSSYSAPVFSYANFGSGQGSDWLNTASLIADEGLSDKESTGSIFKVTVGEDVTETFDKLQRELEVSGAPLTTKRLISLENPSGSLTLRREGTGEWLYLAKGYAPYSMSALCRLSFGLSSCSSNWAIDASVIEKQPSSETLLAKTQRILAASGSLVDDSSIALARSSDGIVARARYLIAGYFTPIEWQVSFDNSGRVVAASGHYFVTDEIGQFDVISPKDALPRFNNWNWRAATEKQITTPWNMRLLCYCVSPNLMRTGNEDEPKPSFVVKSLNQTIGLVFDTDNGAWLVPAYNLPQYQTRGVIAVEENVFKLPK